MLRALTLFAGFTASAQATTIVAIWTPAKLVIVGDSLLNLVSTLEDGRQRTHTAKECKIRKIGKNYISAAGTYHVRSAGFDIWDSAAHACTSAKNLEACVSKLKPELKSGLERVLQKNRENRKEGMPLHEVRLTVLVAGLQGGAPAMDHITFLGTSGAQIAVSTESFRKSREVPRGRVILGHRDAIDRYERTHPPKPAEDLEQEAAALVRMEARALPKDVGPPYSTLIIESGGDHWIEPGCCGLDGCKPEDAVPSKPTKK